ncbi:hypothetical protein [Streptomyces sp. NBC_01306]|uniref:hypothetical protein n=1 Tax=Streptomyces sp. NBC_01306 TaxID=2903819 RepID=UPI0022594D8D|nr:hypothetical protein [Streptomyces sp. NBC_01306]MCX4723551.1 hypothetical protein [Streptomyces sp. NBC_01306]
MNRSRALPAAVSFAAAAALLLTGCGGGDKGSGNDKIAGADGGGAKKTAAPSKPAPSKAPGIDRPVMKFPSDVSLVFDKASLPNADQAAALGDAENFVRAVIYGVTKHDVDNSAYKFYSEFQSPAQQYAKEQIQKNIDAGLTATGVSRYTGAKVQMVKGTKSAVVTFCSNDSKFYSKEIKSAKVHKTEESLSDYAFWQVGMMPSTATKGLWRASEIKVQGEAAQCRG